jgi:TonB family protein
VSRDHRKLKLVRGLQVCSPPSNALADNWRAFGVVLAAMVVAGCGASPAMRAANAGDRASLRGAIGVRERTGDLSNAEAADLAKAVASHELRSAPAASALDRVHDVRPCARELDDSLADRQIHPRARACYNRGLRDDATQRGRIVVRVHVAAGGEVDEAEVASNTGLSEAVARCVAVAARAAGFDPPGGVGSTINIPFNFKLADHDAGGGQSAEPATVRPPGQE